MVVKSEIQENHVELVQKLIANQYRVFHHAQRYIFDLAKIASILLGVVSFFGIPQILSFTSDNLIIQAFVNALAVSFAVYAILCCIAVLLAVNSAGGISLRLEGDFVPSLWWFSSKKLTAMRKIKKPERLQKKFEELYKSLADKITDTNVDEKFHWDVFTLGMLYFCTQEQLDAARRIRKILVRGLMFALGVLASVFLIALVL